MKVKFIHTADWQLGKPFAGVGDAQKRALLQNERFAAVRRIGEVVRECGAAFVLVAGDLFDSPRATKATVSAACSAIGSIGVPVLAIPGNHDHGGVGSLWEQEFFQREREQLAPNFQVLLSPAPLEVAGCLLLPCPLLRRHESVDPTAWLRDLQLPGDHPRIAIAHGSVQQFGSIADEDDLEQAGSNLLDLARLPEGEFDYIALGDWHGTKQIDARTWYSGTPELDRFVKGGDHDPGNILIVEAKRGQLPSVHSVRTANVGWHELSHHFTDDDAVGRLKELVDGKVGTRANTDLLKLDLTGVVDMHAATRLDQMIEAWSARLLRLKLDNQTTMAPSAEELESLTRRADAPLISRVAEKLAASCAGASPEAAVSRAALRELYAACTNPA